MSDCPHPAIARRHKFSEWSNEKVRDWLKENKITTENNRLGELDGSQLHGLQIHFDSDPSSFYKSMKRELNADYKDVLSLLAAFRKI